MSSFVSKSKKAFKPKAPQARRADTSASGTPSVRGSQEPQTQQTPQPLQRASAPSEAAKALNAGAYSVHQSLPASPGKGGRQQSTTDNIENSTQRTPQRTPAASPAVAARAGTLPTPVSTQLSSGSQVGAQNGQGQQVPATPGDGPESSQTTTRRTRKQAGRVSFAPELVTPSRTPVSTAAPVAAADETGQQGAAALLQLSQEPRRDESAGDARSSEAKNQQSSPKRKSRRSTRQSGPQTSEDAVQDVREEAATVETNQSSGRQRTRARLAISGDASDHSHASAQPQSRRGKRTRNESLTEEAAEPDSADNPATAGSRKRQKTTASKKTMSNRSKARKSAEDQAEAIVAAATASTRKKSSTRKRKSSLAAEGENGNGAARAANNEDSEEDDDDNTGQKTSHRRRSKRAKTPEDAEQRTIDGSTQVLAELPNMRIGRLGPRELKLRERDEQRAAEEKAARRERARADLEALMDIPEGEERDRARRERAEREAQEQEEAARREERERVWRIEDEGEWSFKPRGRWGTKKSGDEEGEEGETTAAQGDAATDNAAANGSEDREDSPFVNVFQATGAGFRIVDGNIVADPNARALEAPTSTTVMEERVETDIDRRVTGASFSHREPRGRWDADRTALFYEGLRRWGTDFGMVATWVPGMSRNQVKRKYTQEEKLRPELVLDALKKENRIATTLAEIREKRGRPLRDPKEWQADMDRREGEMRAKALADKAQADEMLRNRGTNNNNNNNATQGKQKQKQQQQQEKDDRRHQEQDDPAGGDDGDEGDDQIETEGHRDAPRQSIETADQEDGDAVLPSDAATTRGRARSGRGGRGRGGRAKPRGGRGAVNPHIVNHGMP